MIPSLLLRPEGSYSWTPEEGVQEVTPTVGSNVTVVSGQYGTAWRGVSSDSNSVIIVNDGNSYVSENGGTIIARIKPTDSGTVYAVRVPPIGAVNNLSLGRHGNGGIFGFIGFTQFASSSTHQWDIGDFHTVAVSYDDTRNIRLFRDGVSLSVKNPTRGEFTEGLGGVGVYTDGIADVESILMFPTALPDAEITRISTMPEAWTMENVSTPEMRVKQSGAVVRVAGMWTKRNGLLKETRLG